MLRGLQQQLNEEFLATYKRMTDPEERKKATVKESRERFTKDLLEDAGL